MSCLRFSSKTGSLKASLIRRCLPRRFDVDILVVQVNQSPSGIFINQSNYVNEILRKYRLNTCDIIGTLMDIKDKLDLDQIGTPVDATKYRSMIGALMYLTSSRPNIVNDSSFELTGFSDADYAGCKDTFKSTSRYMMRETVSLQATSEKGSKIKILDHKHAKGTVKNSQNNKVLRLEDNSPRINRNAGYENQRIGNVAGARENVGSSVVQKSGIQCYNCKEFGHVARECQKPKRAKDAAYHREKMLLCKQEEAGIQLNANQADWRDDTDDDELEDQELEANYMYMAQLQEVSLDTTDDNHCKREEIDQNADDNDLAKERELLASLIEKLKCEIEESKNQMKSKLSAHQETISILSKQKEAQIKLYKTREDNELDKVIELENKVKVLDNIVYKTALNYDEVIRLEKEIRSKLSDLIRPFDYDKLNNLYDLFVPQCEKSFEQCYFSERSRLSHINVNNGKSKESFNKQTTFLKKRMDESIPLDKQCQSSLEIFKVKSYVKTIISGVELANKKSLTEHILATLIHSFKDLKAQLQDKGIVISELKKLIKKLKEKSVDTKFEKSSVIRQPNAFKSQKPSVLGKPTTFLNSFVRKDFSKSTSVTQTHVSNDFLKPVTAQTLPTNKKSILKNTNVLAPEMYKLHTEPNPTRTSQLPQDYRKTNKRVSFSIRVTPTTSVSRPQLKSNPQGDRVLHNNSQGKTQEVEDQCRSVKLSKNKKSITGCNDSLNAKTLNVKSVSAMCDKCVLIDKHAMCVLNSVAKPLKETVASESNKKPRNFTRKLYERVSKTCSWWYPKFTPSGYKWKPKSGKENVNPNISVPLGNASRTANVMDTMTSRQPLTVAEDDETSKDKEIDKLMALISLSFKKIYKPSNNNPRTSSNTSRANQDNSPRINKGTGYENQRIGNVVGARETIGSSVVQKSGIQCYNCKEFGHVAKECQKPKRAKDAAYHREKMLLYAADSGPIFDDEPVQKVSNDDHYNVFAMESVHPMQSKSVHDTYPIKQDAQNMIIDSLDMNYDREEIDQTDDDNDLAKERELLASLIKKLKYEIDESKNRNKILETSNKVLIENLKGETEDFKNKNKSLESSNNFFKEANNKLSETNNLLYADYKKFEAELARRNSKEYASQMELECKKDLKAQLQDKGIVLSELKKLIKKLKGKSVDTKFEKSSVIRQPNAFKRAVTINRVYYVEGFNYNLFSVGQFCDADLEVAFRKSTCFIRDLKGNDLLTGSRGTDLYSITLQDTNSPNPICLMAKATSSQAWLWHRRLSHLNFETINLLSKNDIVVGLPKLKFVKDHLCSS
nr:retrovirus-related Pol polyprotein from transposon TNT 1-94 [Tanacetum cinerariifolium]